MAITKRVAGSSMYVWALLRMVFGYIFLWAFFDKLFGLGFTTCRGPISGGVTVGCSDAWVRGGSPTAGFLSHGTSGPLVQLYHGLAGSALVDWAFMLGLLVIGVGLFFGIYVRVAAFLGVAMLVLMWSALLWPMSTPGVDEHVVYALALFGIALVDEDQVWGFRARWARTSLVKSMPFLK